MLRHPSSQQGFTLVELVAVIVLLGVIGAATTQFIRSSVGIYQDTARRDALTQMGRFAVERVSRELRNALPGSIRVSGDNSCLEFSPIEAASSYIGSVAESDKTSLQAVDFQYGSTAVNNRRIAVHTIDATSVYGITSNAVVDLDNVDTVASNERTVNFKNFSGAGHRFSNESLSRRFYIITRPVSFCVRGGQLFRHENYGWPATQSTSTSTIGSGVLLAEDIQLQNSSGTSINVFEFSAGTLQRAGVVHLNFNFRDDVVTDEWVQFSQDVSIRNTP